MAPPDSTDHRRVATTNHAGTPPTPPGKSRLPGVEGKEHAPALAQWAAAGSALLLGALVAAHDPGMGTFDRLVRSGGLSGPVLQPLALLWTALWVFLTLVLVYLLVGFVIRAVVPGRR